jgi:hypothetical protein
MKRGGEDSVVSGRSGDDGVLDFTDEHKDNGIFDWTNYFIKLL